MKCPKCGYENPQGVERCGWAFCDHEFAPRVVGPAEAGPVEEQTIFHRWAEHPGFKGSCGRALRNQYFRFPIFAAAGLLAGYVAALAAPGPLSLVLTCALALALTVPVLFVLAPERLVMDLRDLERRSDPWTPEEMSVHEPTFEDIGRIWWAVVWRKLIVGSVGYTVFGTVLTLIACGVPLSAEGVDRFKQVFAGFARSPLVGLCAFALVETVVWWIVLGKDFIRFRLVIVAAGRVAWSRWIRLAAAFSLAFLGYVILSLNRAIFSGDLSRSFLFSHAPETWEGALFLILPLFTAWLVVHGRGHLYGLGVASRVALVSEDPAGALAGVAAAPRPASAGFVLRRGAFLADLLLVGGPVALASGLLALLPGEFGSGAVAAAVTVTALAWTIYATLAESSPRQATLGKIWFDLKTVDLDGARLSRSRAAIRAVAKGLSTFVPGLQFGFLTCYTTVHREPLHDTWSRTAVVPHVHADVRKPRWVAALATPGDLERKAGELAVIVGGLVRAGSLHLWRRTRDAWGWLRRHSRTFAAFVDATLGFLRDRVARLRRFLKEHRVAERAAALLRPAADPVRRSFQDLVELFRKLPGLPRRRG